jgi:hypothetical protein
MHTTGVTATTTTPTKEVAMSAHTTTVTEIEPGIFGGGLYRIECTCGERVTYRGQAFTQVEAQRHEAWHARQAVR